MKTQSQPTGPYSHAYPLPDYTEDNILVRNSVAIHRHGPSIFYAFFFAQAQIDKLITSLISVLNVDQLIKSAEATQKASVEHSLEESAYDTEILPGFLNPHAKQAPGLDYSKGKKRNRIESFELINRGGSESGDDSDGEQGNVFSINNNNLRRPPEGRENPNGQHVVEVFDPASLGLRAQRVDAWLQVADMFRQDPGKQPDYIGLWHMVAGAIGIVSALPYIASSKCGWHNPEEIWNVTVATNGTEHCLPDHFPSWPSFRDYALSLPAAFSLNAILNYYYIFLVMVSIAYASTGGLAFSAPKPSREQDPVAHENFSASKTKKRYADSYRKLAVRPSSYTAMAAKFVVFSILAGASAIPFMILDYEGRQNWGYAFVTEASFSALHFEGIRAVVYDWRNAITEMARKHSDCWMPPKSDTARNRNIGLLQKHVVARFSKGEKQIRRAMQTGEDTTSFAIQNIYNKLGKGYEHPETGRFKALTLISALCGANIIPDPAEPKISASSAWFKVQTLWDSRVVSYLRSATDYLTFGAPSIEGHSPRRYLTQLVFLAGSVASVMGYILDTNVRISPWFLKAGLTSINPYILTCTVLSPFLLLVANVGLVVGGDLYDIAANFWKNKSSLVAENRTWKEAFADLIQLPIVFSQHHMFIGLLLFGWAFAAYSSGTVLFLNALTLPVELPAINTSSFRNICIAFTVVFNASPLDKVFSFWTLLGKSIPGLRNFVAPGSQDQLNFHNFSEKVKQQLIQMDPCQFMKLLSELKALSQEKLHGTNELTQQAKMVKEALDNMLSGDLSDVFDKKALAYFGEEPPSGIPDAIEILRNHDLHANEQDALIRSSQRPGYGALVDEQEGPLEVPTRAFWGS